MYFGIEFESLFIYLLLGDVNLISKYVNLDLDDYFYKTADLRNIASLVVLSTNPVHRNANCIYIIYTFTNSGRTFFLHQLICVAFLKRIRFQIGVQIKYITISVTLNCFKQVHIFSTTYRSTIKIPVHNKYNTATNKTMP